MSNFGKILALVLGLLSVISRPPPRSAPSAPPTPAASESAMPAFGVQFHGTWGDYTDEQRAQVLDELKAAGVRWVRIDLGWNTFQEQGPGTYASWYTKLADGAINAARSPVITRDGVG